MSYTVIGKKGNPNYLRLPKRNIMRNQPAVRKIAKQEAKKACKRLGETKFSDRTLSATTVDYNGQVFGLLGLLNRGDSDNTFDGDEITPNFFKYKVLVRMPNAPATDAVNDSAFRMIIFQVRGTWIPATTSDVIVSGTAGTSSLLGDYNMDTKKNFRVISDRTYTLVAGNSDVIKISGQFSKMRKISFISSDVTPPLTYEAGGLYALFISDTNGVNSLPIRGFFRTYYKDN